MAKPELDTPMGLDRKALKEAPTMSSIPAAKEKTSARAVLEAWDRRVTELLAANNSYLERARRAEAENAKLRAERDEALEALRSAKRQAENSAWNLAQGSVNRPVNSAIAAFNSIISTCAALQNKDESNDA